MIRKLEIPEFDHMKFLSKILIVGDCWVFQGSNSNGYRSIGLRVSRGVCKNFLGHRLSYHIFNGALEQLKVIDHVCRNRACVNPDHLRQVTPKVNTTENSLSFTASNALKTHCPRGHEYSGPNLLLKKNKQGIWRACRTCNNYKQNEYFKRKKEALIDHRRDASQVA